MISRRLPAVLAAVLATACSGGGGGGPGTPGPDADPRVDLAASIEAPAAATPGATVTVRYAVRNAGSVPSPWVAELRFGHPTTPWELRDVRERYFGTTALGPGDVAGGTEVIAIPAGLAGGTWEVGLRVTAAKDGHPGNDLATDAFAVSGPACADDAFEADDLPAEARALAVGVEAQHNFCFDHTDWHRFEATAGERLGLRVVGEGEAVSITILSAVDPGATTVTTLWTQHPGVPVAGRFTAPAAGTYGLLAWPTGGRYGPGRAYAVTLLPARPDPRALALYVDRFHATPAGGVATVRADVTNDGFEMTGPATIEFVLSADERLDASDRRIHRDTVPALAVDEWFYRDYLVPIPPDVAPGEWSVLAVVDPDDALPELVEENNVSPADAIFVVAAECAPDAFEDDDRPADADLAALRTPQHRNHCEDAHDWVRVEAAAGDAFTIEAEPSHRPQSLSLRVLGPGGAIVAEQEGSYGVVLGFEAATSGTYWIEAGSDFFGDWQDYVLTVTEALPDLTAYAMPGAFGQTLVPGGVTAVDVRCENRSATAAGPFAVGVYLSRDGAVDDSDVPLGTLAVAGATRGGACGAALPVALPASLGTGAWQLLAKADPDGLVEELDEANNAGAPWEVQLATAPCAGDAHEQDDLPASATPLPLGAPQSRNHCDDGRDWVAVAVATGDPLAVRIDQLGAGARYGLELYADDGKTRLASDADALFWIADRTGTVLVCAGCADAPAWSGPATYRLTAALCPPDANEPDDTAAAARPITPGTALALNGCDGDDDWLAFDAFAGASYSLTVTATGGAQAPAARFVDEKGFPLPVSRQGAYEPAASGRAYVQVRPPMTPTLIDSGYTLTLTAR